MNLPLKVKDVEKVGAEWVEVSSANAHSAFEDEGDDAVPSEEPVRDLVLRILRDAGEDGLTSGEVVEAGRRAGPGPGRTNVDKALRALVSERVVERTGRGAKGSPFRFRLRLPSSPPLGGDE